MTADFRAIANVLARYALALDTKTYALLSDVFTPDVTADYPFNRNLQGVENVAKAIEERLGPILTHHCLTTQSITFKDDGSVVAETYFVGFHFGQGPHEGKVLQAWGKYVDELTVTKAADGDVEGVPGASGVWRIRKRTVVFKKRIGDEAIMKEF